MDHPEDSAGTISDSSSYDAVVVGASLAGCATAILLARAGASVALVEKRPDEAAFKRVCSHYIQSSAVPTLERLGLMEALKDAGALRSGIRAWTRWGWVIPPSDSAITGGLNLRRERLDPLIRGVAAETPGVEAIHGQTAHELLREDGHVCGVALRDRNSNSTRLRARVVIGADGRDSRVAELAAVRSRTYPHKRFAYGGYFEGPPPVGAPDSSVWLLDPQWAAAFPTDSGLTFYACMPTKEHLPEFRADPTAALVAMVSGLPDAPPIAASRLIEPLVGKLEMPNVKRTPAAPGLALVGDAALATDPLWGVGCGWALQSAEWLADSIAPALAGKEALQRGLDRYRRRHARGLGAHATMIHSYATGRRLNPGERLIFSGATHDPHLARSFEAFGSRNISPLHFLASALPRAAVLSARSRISQRGSQHAPRPDLERA